MISAPCLSKLEINLLPLKKYEGPLEVIAGDERLREIMPELHAEKVLGFDIEVRPTFKSGDHFPPALVQLAGRKKVFLVQLKKLKSLHLLGALFADARIIKAGVAVAGDIAKLHEIMRFTPAGFVELGKMAAKAGIKASGVRTLAAQLLGLRDPGPDSVRGHRRLGLPGNISDSGKNGRSGSKKMRPQDLLRIGSVARGAVSFPLVFSESMRPNYPVLTWNLGLFVLLFTKFKRKGMSWPR
jgi:hypothetical protein